MRRPVVDIPWMHSYSCYIFTCYYPYPGFNKYSMAWLACRLPLTWSKAFWKCRSVSKETLPCHNHVWTVWVSLFNQQLVCSSYTKLLNRSSTLIHWLPNENYIGDIQHQALHQCVVRKRIGVAPCHPAVAWLKGRREFGAWPMGIKPFQ